MTVRVYYSTDASAPVLSGTAGALIGVLDACLVNGYGAKAAAGWAKTYTGTNKAVYRAATGNRHYLRIDDSATNQGRAIGYESMSDVDTGTAGFPTDAQYTGGLYWHKSNAASSDPRQWMLIATGTTFYFYMNANAGSPTVGQQNHNYMFGEFVSYKTGDAYNTMITGANTTSPSADHQGLYISAHTGAISNGKYVARAYTQIGASKISGFTSAAQLSLAGGTAIGFENGSYNLYPDNTVGGVPLERIRVHTDDSPSIRGHLPGIWAPACAPVGTHSDTFTGSGDFSGKTFIVAFAQGYGRCVYEISDTW